MNGGISDEIVCSTPENRKGKDLLKIPYELYGTCFPTTSHGHQVYWHHSSKPKGSAKHTLPSEHGGNTTHTNCERKSKPRPVNLRHSVVTVAITGVVCGIICLMMLAAAVYGCAYAVITAKYHQENSYPGKEKGSHEEKEPFENSLA